MPLYVHRKNQQDWWWWLIIPSDPQYQHLLYNKNYISVDSRRVALQGKIVLLRKNLNTNSNFWLCNILKNYVRLNIDRMTLLNFWFVIHNYKDLIKYTVYFLEAQGLLYNLKDTRGRSIWRQLNSKGCPKIDTFGRWFLFPKIFF